MRKQTQYELVEFKELWENGEPKLVEVSKLESGIDALLLTLKNKYNVVLEKKLAIGRIQKYGNANYIKLGFRFSTPEKGNLSNYNAEHFVTIRKVPKRKIQERKFFKSMMDKTEKLLCKYRKAYDKCLDVNDRETGAIVEYYCRKLSQANTFWFKSYIGALS